MNKAKAGGSRVAVRAKPDDVNYQWNKVINTQPEHRHSDALDNQDSFIVTYRWICS